MKKKLFVLAVLAIILAGMATGTLAYYTAKSDVQNVITSGSIDIDLVETMKNEDGQIVPYPTDPVGGIMPGTEHSKIVNVKNVGEHPAWVRVKVTKSIKVDGKSQDDSVLSLDLNTTEWIDGEDGYYYYKDILAPGATTAKPLFTKVNFAGEKMGNEYQNARIEIGVQAQGVQSENNPAPTGGDVTDVKGWPKSIVAALLG